MKKFKIGDMAPKISGTDQDGGPIGLEQYAGRKVVLYGVWGKKKFMGRTYQGIHRTTYIISETGLIEDIITKVETKHHSEQILANN